MKASVIATLFAATLLSTAFVPASFAQDSKMPKDVEVVTITAKRPAPTMALACVNQVIVQARAATATGQASAQSGELQDIQQLQQSISNCIAQGTSQGEVQI